MWGEGSDMEEQALLGGLEVILVGSYPITEELLHPSKSGETNGRTVWDHRCTKSYGIHMI